MARLAMSYDERKCSPQPSELAKRKTNRLKRKDLRSACVSKSQFFFSYLVSKEYAVIVVRTIMLKWICVERKLGAPVGCTEMVLLTAHHNNRTTHNLSLQKEHLIYHWHRNNTYHQFADNDRREECILLRLRCS